VGAARGIGGGAAMKLTAAALEASERLAWPDPVLRAGVGMLVGRTKRRLRAATAAADEDFARRMTDFPIAINTREANGQHYEVPAEFFALMLGPRRKYSCCYYDDPAATLIEAEERALTETARHADLADGQQILELGCGWGSLSLWMARHYPHARIMSVSNSQSQRAFIAQRAEAEGLRNLTVIAADMNAFMPQGAFDRIVSVEMFEHMSNWRDLLKRAASWLKPDGRLFIHIFSHRSAPYRFDASDHTDWIAQHFFTGGIMPSHGLIRQFSDLVEVEEEWWWNGNHYRRTAEQWLENFDRNAADIVRVLRGFYGADALLWQRRWRLFLLATSGLFGHSGGNEWGVSHYRLRRA
jgi:cyclopropane-fatty-acyl-phospholipid synthase